MNEYPIDLTPFGKAGIVPTGNGHYHVDANSNGRPGLTVNGVEYHVSAHFQVQPDGSVEMDKYLYGSRPLGYGRSFRQSEMTESARKRLRMTLPPLVAAWIATHADEVAEADEDRRRIDAAIKDEQAQRLVGELTEKLRELIALDPKRAQALRETLAALLDETVTVAA